MDPPTKGKVVVRTSLGPVDIELFSKESPKTCRAFVQLCQEGYYNHQMVFARIIKNVLVETGSSIGADKTEDGLPFASENHGRLRFTVRGRVACVHNASSDIFITLDKSEWLNGKHTIFGKVVGDSLFNVVRIGELDTDKHDKPYDAPEILGVDVVDNPFDDIVCRVLSKKIVPPLASDRSGHSLLQKKIINREGVVKKAPVLSFGGIHKLEDGDGEDGGGGGGGGEQNSSRLMKRSLSEATAAELSLKKRFRLDGAGNVHQEDEEDVEGEDGRRGGRRSKMDDQSEIVNSLKGFSSIPVSAQDAAAAAAARRKEEYARLKRELKAAKEKGIPSNGSNITSATAASLSSSQLSRDVTASSDEKRDSTINSSSSSKSSGLSILQQMRGKYAAAKEKASGHSNSGHSTTSARDASTLEKLAAFTSKLKTTKAFGFDSLSSSSSSSSPSNNEQGGGLKFVRHIDDESRGLYLGVGAGKAEYSPSRSEAAATRAGYGASSFNARHNAKNESSAIKRAVDENISTEDLADAIMREIQDEMKM